MGFGTNDPLNFCVMTSSNYITKALVMYDSLLKECEGQFRFFYFAFDDLTYGYLKKLNYENITPIRLSELEEFFPELREIKSTRNNAEYFFTCTPHIIDYSLKRFNIDHIIYLDADLFFYQNPKIILNELKNNSVLITEHRYYPATNDHPSGKYCVQFIPFVNDLYGNRVISWWKTRCIEWCYLRAEDGKWADQGYLNDWPSLFEKIVVMENRGGGIANWNMDGHKFFKEKSILQAYNEETKSNIDVIFYHFQGVKIFNNGLISLGIYKRNMNVYNFIYKDYLNRLSEKENELISKIEISRDQFNYQDYPDSNFKYFFKLLRMYIFPKENDLINYYNFFKKYRWLH